MKSKTKSKLKNKEYLKHPENSIFQLGYGQIAKLVMVDKELTAESKAIYGYICSYAGGGNQAFPSVSRMCSDLVMTKQRFYKHLNILIERGYISKIVEFDKDLNCYQNNVYVINYTIP